MLIIVILFLRNCGGKVVKPPKSSTTIKTEIRWDTITKIVPTYIPKWGTRIINTTDTLILYKNIDTTEILKDYFASYAYFDTLSMDSVTILINDTISQNKIKNRSITYKMLYPTVTITKETILNKREFYVGLGAGGNVSQLSYVGVEILFRSKKKTALRLGVGVNQTFTPTFMGGLYWKLGK